VRKLENVFAFYFALYMLSSSHFAILHFIGDYAGCHLMNGVVSTFTYLLTYYIHCSTFQ